MAPLSLPIITHGEMTEGMILALPLRIGSPMQRAE